MNRGTAVIDKDVVRNIHGEREQLLYSDILHTYKNKTEQKKIKLKSKFLD